MQYIKRTLERKFNSMSGFFKCVLVTGARQVGKTTMLRHLSQGQNRTYVTLDNINARAMAKSDPALFFQTYKPPIIIDEVQYAPELFSQIKILCDESDEKGLFWLTGSQQYGMMKSVRESLAGRIGILELYTLSKSEKERVHYEGDLDFSFSGLHERQAERLSRFTVHEVGNSNKTLNEQSVNEDSKNQNPNIESANVSAGAFNAVDVYEHIWRGGMPYVLKADQEQMVEYFNSYVSSYIMRDAAEQGGITDSLRFGKFLSACAALLSEQVNTKKLADLAEVSQPTVKEWLALLEGMGIVYLLRPYSNNALKRLAKMPKLYFCDTGLAAFLSMWPTKETLMTGAASGHYFENHVVMELRKNFAYAKDKAAMTYYRDSNAKEIDIIVEKSGFVHPLEIKKSANPDKRLVKKFDVLEKSAIPQGYGGIVCMCEEVLPVDERNCLIPCNLI